LLLSLLTLRSNAQDSIRVYPFMDLKANRLMMPADSSTFATFFQRLNALRDRSNSVVRIAHIGGSHVQGGTWSNTFLSALQSRYGTMGGGYFIFPYRIGHTNGPQYARSFSTGKWKLCRSLGKQFCTPLGMSALSVSTADSSSVFGCALTEKAACRKFNAIRVYHNFNSAYAITPALDTSEYSRFDVMLEGYTIFTMRTRLLDSIAFNLTRRDTSGSFVLYGLSLEDISRPGIYLAALGANGASSGSFLRAELLQSQLATMRPDLVILSLGVNDTQSKGFSADAFIENYDSLIAVVRKAAPSSAIILTTTTDNFIRRKSSNKRTVPAREATLELMRRHNVAVWDLFTVMGGYKSMQKWYKSGLASKDKVHFNTRGYGIVGTLMFRSLMEAGERFAK
jgi:lysophospholipase L1-like esterase